jgi:hypothetical protein
MRKKVLYITVFLVIIIISSPFVYNVIRWKTYIWITNYFLASSYEKCGEKETDMDVFLIVADHYEPGWGKDVIKINEEWLRKYCLLADRHKDGKGRPLQHTWFYPMEQFNDRVMADLSEMARRGYGEVELHWHHSNDTSESCESKLKEGIRKFNRYGALISKDGKVAFGFIHGNWGLDNSLGSKRCGVNNELEILARNGCYADFTFSTVGTDAQPRKINSIYYAKDTPAPKSYDTGIDLAVGKKPSGDLVIFEGPMGYIFLNNFLQHNWFPFYVEYGAIENDPKPAPFRVKNWIRLSEAVKGKPDWRFIKLYTHGQQSADSFFSQAMEETLIAVRKEISSRGWRLHYVTAREAYNVAKAAEAGLQGNPENYYDWLIPAPLNKVTH